MAYLTGTSKKPTTTIREEHDPGISRLCSYLKPTTKNTVVAKDKHYLHLIFLDETGLELIKREEHSVTKKFSRDRVIYDESIFIATPREKLHP